MLSLAQNFSPAQVLSARWRYSERSRLGSQARDRRDEDSQAPFGRAPGEFVRDCWQFHLNPYWPATLCRQTSIPAGTSQFTSAAVSAGAKRSLLPPARRTIASNISGPGRTSGADRASPHGRTCRRKDWALRSDLLAQQVGSLPRGLPLQADRAGRDLLAFTHMARTSPGTTHIARFAPNSQSSHRRHFRVFWVQIACPRSRPRARRDCAPPTSLQFPILSRELRGNHACGPLLPSKSLPASGATHRATRLALRHVRIDLAPPPSTSSFVLLAETRATSLYRFPIQQSATLSTVVFARPLSAHHRRERGEPSGGAAIAMRPLARDRQTLESAA